MPLHTYHCPKCGEQKEHLVNPSEKETFNALCPCGNAMARSGVEMFALGRPPRRRGAILSNGQHVQGHFNQDAPKDSMKVAKRRKAKKK